MARSPKDDPRFSDIQHNTWKFRKESNENCAHGGINNRNQHTISPNPSVMNDNSVYINSNFSGDIYHMNKLPYTGDAVASKDNNVSFNDMANTNCINRQSYGNAMLNLGNGQLVRVFYDENNKQLIFPVSNQYELFKHNNQGIIDSPVQASPSHLFTINQEYPNTNNIHMQPSSATIQNSTFNHQDNVNQAVPTSNFLNEVLGNWEPNSTGTYSPFGQNYPLNHPDAPALNILSNNVHEAIIAPTIKTEASPKRNENSPLADTSNKKRIVAEVKPMRPSYSDVLAKNTKNNNHPDVTRVTKPQVSPDLKSTTNKGNSKPDKPSNNVKHCNDDSKQKNEKKHSTISSGSESGDLVNEETEKRQKPSKKSKKHVSQKWSSFDDVPNEEQSSVNGNRSQFMFIENQTEKLSKKEKKGEKNKSFEKNIEDLDDFKFEEDDESQFVFQDNPADSSKTRKKKEGRNHHKNSKPLQDKKKNTLNKLRKHKPGYFGLAQGYLEHWGEATWKAFIWFFYLLSDIFGMSLHLSFDLCTSVFTQTFVSSQTVWKSTKDRLMKIGDNKYLLYVDRKFGHTRIGFWRKLKWLKKDQDSNNEPTKLSENIPLPSTGEEAMKRLLACKGKDPYSILGVSVTCTDEEIKRYYRRQAFLVHPDKNQQPGAEEAFKILQHAFDIIGEPERREAYERGKLASEATWSELSQLLTQLHDKMEFAANTIRCTNCGRRHKRVLTDRPCYAARYCAQCKIRHSAKEGDIWAESSMLGFLVMYYACIDGAVYQITQWASCQKKNLRQLRPDCHVVQYRIVLGNKSGADVTQPSPGHEPNLEEFLNNLYNKSGAPHSPPPKPSTPDDAKKRRNKKTKP